MSTIEQIIICKFVLYSYIYHHQKVRAAEGLLAKTLRKATAVWKAAGMDDTSLLHMFMDLTDPSLYGSEFLNSESEDISYYCRRISQRLLPREVFGFVSSMFSHEKGEMLANFISVLLDKTRRAGKMKEFESELWKSAHQARSEPR